MSNVTFVAEWMNTVNTVMCHIHADCARYVGRRPIVDY